MPTLDIIIPTFNRQPKVAARVGELVPQLTETTRLIVLDNASMPPVEVFADAPNKGVVKVIRSSHNVGLSGNIIKAFSLAHSEWLWILGDDDPVLDDAVDHVLQQCISEDVVCVVFSPPSKGPAQILSFDNLLATGRWIEATQISSVLWNVRAAKEHLSAAYTASGAFAPHMGPLISIGSADPVRPIVKFVPQTIVNVQVSDYGSSQALTRFYLLLLMLYPHPLIDAATLTLRQLSSTTLGLANFAAVVDSSRLKAAGAANLRAHYWHICVFGSVYDRLLLRLLELCLAVRGPAYIILKISRFLGRRSHVDRFGHLMRSAFWPSRK